MSQWLFDLGNTRLKWAQLQPDGSLTAMQALPHDAEGFADALRGLLPAHAEAACLASVASQALTSTVIEILTQHFQTISIARSVAQFAGVRIAYADPSRLGVDRFLAMLAARARGAGPWVIAGVGTALTIDLLDADGVHRGGRIGPSPQIMREALHRAASHLPAQGGEYTEFATDTGDALASGCEGAALGLIERSLAQTELVLGKQSSLLLHGGGAAALAMHLPQAIQMPAPVLEGLALWSRAGAALRIPAC